MRTSDVRTCLETFEFKNLGHPNSPISSILNKTLVIEIYNTQASYKKIKPFFGQRFVETYTIWSLEQTKSCLHNLLRHDNRENNVRFKYILSLNVELDL